MAKNDIVLLDGILDAQLADGATSTDRGEAFERFSLEQVLRDYDLSSDDIAHGWCDGKDDGGIDAFYTLINGVLIDDPADFPWPKTHAVMDVWVVNCKHHDTFRQVTLDTLHTSLAELLDLSLSPADFKGAYSEELVALRQTFGAAYRRLSIGRPTIRFHVVYASRGDSSSVGESVAARARQIEALITSLFSSATADFEFVGAAELVDLHRRGRRFTLELPFREQLSATRESYVVLARLDDYHRFISEESGALRRYLFDSNVRDFLGASGPNGDIALSLANPSGPEFWWLNNGVTILATSASVVGKVIQLENVQIVNGLQTSESIHAHFAGAQPVKDERSVLVKVVVSSDALTRDAIIRATNNQNPVDISALHATDKIQRDIEAVLEKHDWFYERRKNYYRFVGKPAVRFVTPTYVATAAVALVHRHPKAASNLKPKFMRQQERYEAVFSESLPLRLWPCLVAVFKQIDASFPSIGRPQRKQDRFLRTWRPTVSLIATAIALGTFDYKLAALEALGASAPLPPEAVDKAWRVVTDVLNGSPTRRKEGQSFIHLCCEEAARRHGLAGIDVVGKRSILAHPAAAAPAAPPPPEFVDAVNALLPEQPWKPGVHREVASQLQCPPKLVTAAIAQLIREQRRFDQTDGVVRAPDGRIVAIDHSRTRVGATATQGGGGEPAAQHKN